MRQRPKIFGINTSLPNTAKCNGESGSGCDFFLVIVIVIVLVSLIDLLPDLIECDREHENECKEGYRFAAERGDAKETLGYRPSYFSICRSFK